jgi:hypothetical protein
MMTASISSVPMATGTRTFVTERRRARKVSLEVCVCQRELGWRMETRPSSLDRRKVTRRPPLRWRMKAWGAPAPRSAVVVV